MKKTAYFLILCFTLLGCMRSQRESQKADAIHIAALKACDCSSVSVRTFGKNGRTAVDIIIEKTKSPDFARRITKIMKQVKKDVKGFCDTDEIKIHFVSNTYKIEDRTYVCECPEEKTIQPDSITPQFSGGFTCKASSSKIVQRATSQRVLIISIRDLNESVKSENETIEYLKEKLGDKYPQMCESIDEVEIEFYTGADGYHAVIIKCEKFFKD